MRPRGAPRPGPRPPAGGGALPPFLRRGRAAARPGPPGPAASTRRAATDKLRFEVGDFIYFEVEATWTNQHGGGTPGKGRPVRLSEQSGYFWFFDPGISEVTIKILDGQPINSHYWIFLGSMTEVDVMVTVRLVLGTWCQQQGTCPTRTTISRPAPSRGSSTRGLLIRRA